ncbi:hypothetical protein [Streptomyces globisporus]|uniref:hypothetical protein n=1 Tax=Streptomyces globisporus TaxID=1908 RepID=UPI0037B956E2
MSEGTLYGLASLVVGGGFSVAVAWVSRPRSARPEEADAVEAERQELTTVEGIASVVVQQGRRIHQQDLRIDQLQEEQAGTVATVGALTRYVRVLRSTISGLGHPVPAPAPEDAHLIDL